jgi:hypothetical protein
MFRGGAFSWMPTGFLMPSILSGGFFPKPHFIPVRENRFHRTRASGEVAQAIVRIIRWLNGLNGGHAPHQVKLL